MHLRGFNVASYPHCTCGIIKNQRKEFTARYQFKSSSDRLKIMPQSGVLQSNEFIAVNFMFKPKLPKNMIFENGLRLKMNVDEQETRTEKIDESAKEGIFINAKTTSQFRMQIPCQEIKKYDFYDIYKKIQ